MKDSGLRNTSGNYTHNVEDSGTPFKDQSFEVASECTQCRLVGVVLYRIRQYSKVLINVSLSCAFSSFVPSQFVIIVVRVCSRLLQALAVQLMVNLLTAS